MSEHDEIRITPDPSKAEELRLLLHTRLTSEGPASHPPTDTDPDHRADLLMLTTADHPTRETPTPGGHPPARWLLVAAAILVVALVSGLVLVKSSDPSSLDTSGKAPTTTVGPRTKAELTAALLSSDLVWTERKPWPVPPRTGANEIHPARRPVADWGFSHPCDKDDLVWPDESAAGVIGFVHGYGNATQTVLQFQATDERTGEQRAERFAAIINDAASACSEGTITVHDVRCEDAVFPTCVVQRGPFVSVFHYPFKDGDDYLKTIAAAMADSMDNLTPT